LEEQSGSEMLRKRNGQCGGVFGESHAANVTPFTASRLISEWQRSHALEKRRGKGVLWSPERLL